MSGQKLSWIKKQGTPTVTLSVGALAELLDYTPTIDPPSLRSDQVTLEHRRLARLVNSVFPGTRIQVDGIWRPIA